MGVDEALITHCVIKGNSPGAMGIPRDPIWI